MSKAAENEIDLDDVEFEPIEVPKVVPQVSADKLEKKIGVEKDGKYGTTKMSQAMVQDLDSKVEEVITIIQNADAHSKELKDITASLSALGNKEMQNSSKISSGMLSRASIRDMKNNKEGGGAEVARGLSQLRGKMEELDPKRRGVFKKNTLLKLLPFGMGKKVNNYFQEYQSAETALQEIVKTLYNGKDRLQEDNAHIDEDRERMHVLMQHLEQYAYVIKKIDERISEKMPELEASDKLKAEDVKNEILFPIRQKRMDILQQLAVSLQGYLALQVIKKNNIELIAGVDRATSTTMSALRTAMVVSEALGAQKLVLKAVGEVNDYTNHLIATNSELLGQQAGEIQKQASETMINGEVLEKAFTNIFKAMDQMDKYRTDALPQMEKTIGNLENTLNNAKNYMSTRRNANISDLRTEFGAPIEEEDNSVGSTIKIKGLKR